MTSTTQPAGTPGTRYADDAVVHCVSQRQARAVLAALENRMAEVGLRLHPDKTRIVYCKDGKRRGHFEHSKQALKKISGEVRSWRLHLRTHLTFTELARWINPIMRGCITSQHPRLFAHWAWTPTFR